MNMQRCSPLCT